MQSRKKRMYITTAVVIASILVALVAAEIYYYYTLQVPVSVAAPKIQWITGTDISATSGTNYTWCQIALTKLTPNATTGYTSALKFKVLSAPTASDNVLQIASISGNSSIIWGIRFYIFTPGSNQYNLTLVDLSKLTVDYTDGNAPIAQVGYRQSAAPTGYGAASLPTESGPIPGTAGTTYIIAIECYGLDGILESDTCTMQLRLKWT